MRLPKYGFINDINKKLSVFFKDILVFSLLVAFSVFSISSCRTCVVVYPNMALFSFLKE